MRKPLGFGKGQKMNGVATKSIPNQPNAMEGWFACLEVLMKNMASSMAT